MARKLELLVLAFLGLCIVSINCFDESLVDQWPKNTALKYGEEGRLHCTLKPGITYKSMNWQLVTSSGLTQIYYGDATTRKVKEGWTDKFEPAPSSPHDILIKSTTWDHARTYRCGVNDKNADTKEKDATVTVVEKAICKSGDGNEKEDGQTVFLDCSVKYHSPILEPYLPDIKWYDETGCEVRGGSYIDPEIPDGEPTPPPTDPKIRLYRLNKTATEDDDGKKFNCRVSFTDNNYNDTCETSFRVLYPVTGVTFDPQYVDSEGPLKRKVGDFINCTASGNPEPMYTWIKLSIDGGGPDIRLGSQLKMTEDMIGSTNEYKCTAKNTIKGQPRSANRTVRFDVTLKGPGHNTTTTPTTPRTTTEAAVPVSDVSFLPNYNDGDDPLELKVGEHIECLAEGNPKPSYIWRKLTVDGTGIVIVLGSELLIVEDMLKSINVYECTAANVIDGQPKIASGRVKFVATVPVTDIKFQPDYSEEGGPLVLKVEDYIKCTAEGYPTPQYIWRKIVEEGTGADIVPGSRLLIVKDMVGSINEYECTAMNVIRGQPIIASRRVKFDVAVPVTDITFHPSYNEDSDPLVLTEGNYIECTAQGYPEPKYIWRKIVEEGTGTVIVAGSKLLIVKDMVGANNEYECTAINFISDQPKFTSRRVKFDVAVPVTDIILKPNYNEGDNPLILSKGDYIKCNAEGYPKPKYIWRKIVPGGKDTVIIPGPLLLTVEDMIGSINEYECTAVNVIDGHFMSVTHKVKFNVTVPSTDEQTLQVFHERGYPVKYDATYTSGSGVMMPSFNLTVFGMAAALGLIKQLIMS